MNKFLNRMALAGVALSSFAVQAAPIDITAITGANADIALVGAAVFVVMVGIKLTKWVRRAL